MKALLPQPISEEALDILRPVAEVKINQFGRAFTREEFLKELEDVDAVLLPWHTDVMDREAIGKAPKLKVIGRIGLGYENIDIKAATERGIYVTYSPVNAPTVADYTFALMMAVARRMTEADRYCKTKKWDKGGMFVMEGLRGHNVHHKKLGIIGLGRVGALLAKRARGFDMEISYYDPIRKKEMEGELGVRYVPLNELLGNSDFVAVTCALTDSSRGLIGEKELNMMKSTAVLVNTSRGPTVNLKALYEALVNHKILGAGLDVFEKEPIDFDDPILTLDNVVLGPHVAANTHETFLEMQMVACQDVASVLSGKTPKYIINEEVRRITPLK